MHESWNNAIKFSEELRRYFEGRLANSVDNGVDYSESDRFTRELTKKEIDEIDNGESVVIWK